ncbi:ABC transporter permease [Thermomicrobiaceae bacterium CFH 74404]|uniref:ABC transporter permease n=1 Tax=Thermalbibacter longus TaxID=2951981 RepID=A0AA41WES3_9BACT|nr:ABC transporter permease [Thermalbibacter longus]MCM8748753.1 ABC transporter permease [Thermalbibacter longus]
MARYLAHQLTQMVIAIFGISVIVFVITHVIGDPTSVLLPLDTPLEQREEFRRQMGFDRPILVQYADFLGQAIRGDFGNSFRVEKSALSLVLERIPATLLLTASATVLAILIAIPMGILSAYKRHSIIDNIATVFVVAGQAMPIYWLGLMLIILFGVQLKWLPPSGYGEFGIDRLKHLILPTLVLGVFLAPVTERLVRSGMLDALTQDYVRTARAKGLRERVVLTRHALRNAIIPVITVLGLQFGQLLGGAVITETVFAWPGIGQLTVDSIRNADFPVTQAAVITIAVMISVVNTAIDVIVGIIDPRIRF